MSIYSQLAFKFSLTSQAAATMCGDPAWDKAVTAFLRTYSLWQADDKFGSQAKAEAAFDLVRSEAEERYGKGWQQNPVARQVMDAASDILRAAEDESHDRFVAPYWQALRDLANTPAPTIAAAAFKALLIQSEDVWNDANMTADCMQIVQDDFARLAA